MKNPFYFAISVVVMVGGTAALFFKAGFPVGIGVMLVGLLMMIHWNTISYNWICDECGRRFSITMLQNFLGMNGGINYKYLHCPDCRKRTWCKGVPKEGGN